MNFQVRLIYLVMVGVVYVWIPSSFSIWKLSLVSSVWSFFWKKVVWEVLHVKVCVEVSQFISLHPETFSNDFRDFNEVDIRDCLIQFLSWKGWETIVYVTSLINTDMWNDLFRELERWIIITNLDRVSLIWIQEDSETN